MRYMYMCIYIYLYLYLYVYIYMHVNIYIYICNNDNVNHTCKIEPWKWDFASVCANAFGYLEGQTDLDDVKSSHFC